MLRELGELGSVNAVADALYVTPSAVSQQLRLLQSTIDVPLTHRVGRTLALTEAGRALAAAAGDVQVALARARQTVDDFVGQTGGSVTMCAFHSAAAALFPPLLRALGASDGIEVQLADEDVAQATFPALTARYDIVLAHRLDYSPSWPDTVAVTPLLHEPLDIALPDGHPLTGKARLAPNDVVDERWITVHEGFPLIATVTAVSAAAGRPVHIAHRVNEFSIVAELVAAGAGVALMPRWTTPTPPGVTLRPIGAVHARRRIDALYRPEHAVRRPVQTVLRLLEQAAQRLRSS